jgi:hypothetical protein
MPLTNTITAIPTRPLAAQGSTPARPARRSELQPARRWVTGPTRAETLECACPDFCERDHEQD